MEQFLDLVEGEAEFLGAFDEPQQLDRVRGVVAVTASGWRSFIARARTGWKSCVSNTAPNPSGYVHLIPSDFWREVVVDVADALTAKAAAFSRYLSRVPPEFR